VYKYVRICGLEEQSEEISTLANVLFNSFKIGSRDKVTSPFIYNRRYSFLEQDVIAKACIFIYIKLLIGFQKVPFLSCFPP
jgi:hypothetical protein